MRPVWGLLPFIVVGRLPNDRPEAMGKIARVETDSVILLREFSVMVAGYYLRGLSIISSKN